MSYYPIELDKVRNLKYGMRAIDLIEKKFGCPIMAKEGMITGVLTMEEYATVIWAGLVHEDKDLTPDKVMDLIDEHSSLTKVTQDMWEAFNAAYETEKEEEEKEKNK
mgnify:CR=1 FL=1